MIPMYWEGQTAVTRGASHMKRQLNGIAPILLVVLLTGCAAVGPAGFIGFINETAIHSDVQLMELWRHAQQEVSQGIYLNPIQHSLYGAPEHWLPGDVRALNFNPRNIVVKVVPDLTSTQLLIFGVERPEPTGMIVCPQPSDERVATAFSTPARYRTHVAASWEYDEPFWEVVMVWEFENHILYGLGYDLSWR
jgi:hypothetical protein